LEALILVVNQMDTYVFHPNFGKFNLSSLSFGMLLFCIGKNWKETKQALKVKYQVAKYENNDKYQ
jgi:hypothetical protein